MKLTERIQLKKTQILSKLCYKAKNLYNVANYLVRQTFFKENRWCRYYELNELLKKELVYRQSRDCWSHHTIEER